MKRLEAPKMYTQQEASGKDLADVVRQAEVCGNELATLYVRTHDLTGNKAAEVQGFLSRHLTYCNLVTAFEGNKKRLDEADSLIQEPKPEDKGIRIPVTAGKSDNGPVECKVLGDYRGLHIRPTSESGKQTVQV